MIGRALRILFSGTGADFLWWVFAAYNFLNIVNPWPDVIYVQPQDGLHVFIRTMFEKFHWLTLLVLIPVGIAVPFWGLNAGRQALQIAMFNEGLIDDTNVHLPIYKCFQYRLYREYVLISLLKGAAFLLIAYYSAQTEWNARGFYGT